MSFSLTVEKRTEQGKKLETLRVSGYIPAVLYGPKEEPVLLKVEKRLFDKILKAAGETSIISLIGLDNAKDVLIHDVSFDALKGGVIHADFYAVEIGKELTVDVPLEFTGEAPATKVGGVLTKVLHHIEVTCLPKDLPQHITVDVSTLDTFDKQIHISDLNIPSGVTIQNDPEEVVVLVQAVAEEIETESTPIDMSTIGVEKKGKENTEESV